MSEALVQLRRRRRAGVRARTESIRRLSKTALRAGMVEFPVDEHPPRPRTRGECEQGSRPCPFVSCRHHLALDVHSVRGSIKLNFPDRDVDELVETCSLDVAALGGITLEQCATVLNLTRERVRQLEDLAIANVPTALFAQFIAERG